MIKLITKNIKGVETVTGWEISVIDMLIITKALRMLYDDKDVHQIDRERARRMLDTVNDSLRTQGR